MTIRRLVLFIIILFCSVITVQANVNFEANKTDLCSPEAVQFSVLGGLNYDSYLWDFGNGITSSAANPTIVYTQPGIYAVQLTVSSNGNQESETKPAYIKVNAPPIVDFSVNTENGCAPLEANFTDLSAPQSASITNWFWSFGNGATSTEQYPSTIYNEIKGNTVFLKVTDKNGCSATRTKSNFVEVSGPIADFEYDSLVCGIPANISFLNTSTGKNLGYQWSFGNGNSSNIELPSIQTYTAFDSTEVQLIITDQVSGCADTSIKPLIIAKYNADFDFDVSCNETNHSIVFNNKTFPEANQYRWDFDDGSFATETNPIKNYPNREAHRILLTATIDESCKDTFSIEYTPPKAVFTSFAEECSPPMLVEFTNESEGASLSYQWEFGDSTFSKDEQPTHLFSTPPDRYNNFLTVTDTFNCTSTTNRGINAPFPIADFFTIDSITSGCLPLDVGFIDSISYTVDSEIESVIWDFGDPATGNLNSSADFQPNHLYSEPGEYDITYTITLENGCTDQIVKEDFIRVGVAPDSVNFEILPNDTFCFGETIDFEPFTQYDDFILTSNYHCWLFETDSNNRLIDAETPPEDCPSGQGGYNRLDTSINNMNALHEFNNYEYQLQENINGNLVWGEIAPSFGHQYTHLIAGYNGCFKSFVQPNYTDSTALIPGFVFDNDSSDLFLEDTSAYIGIFLSNFNVDSIVHFEIRDAGVSILSLDPNDTNLVSFDAPGVYQLFIEGWNTTSNCNYSFSKNIYVEHPQLELNFTNEICLSNRKMLLDDNSTFEHSQIRKRAFFINDSLYVTTVNFDNDSVFIEIPDTGWNSIRLELEVRFQDRLSPYGLQSRTTNYTYIDSFYVHGTYSESVYDTNFACFGDSILFDHISSGTSPLDSIIWNYNQDSSRSILAPHQFRFLERGVFVPTYTTYNEFGCADTFLADTVTISGPIVQFVLSDTLVCIGEAVEFENKSEGNTLNFEWRTDHTDYFNIDVTHEYATADTFDVFLKATDIFGCQDSLNDINAVEAAPFPIASFELDTNFADCPPLIVQFSDSSSGILSKYNWNFDNGSFSAQTNPLETFIAPGFYDIRLIVTNYGGCRDTLQRDSLIQVNGPTGNYTISEDTVCAPDSVTFLGSYSNTEYFIWNYGDGKILNYETSNVSDTTTNYYTSGGKITPFVQLIDSNNCQFTLPTSGQIVSDSIDTRFNLNDTILCSIMPFEPSNMSRGTFISSYQWLLGNGDSITEFQPIINYGTSGNYTLKLIQNSPIGCIDSTEQFIQIFTDPDDSLLITNKDFCVPNTTDFILRLGNESFVFENLQLNIDGQEYNDSVRLSFDSPGDINVSYEILYGNGQCAIDSSTTIKYYNLPIGDFQFNPEVSSIASNQVLFTAESENATDFYWDFGDNAQSVIENPVHRYSGQGNYDAIFIVSNGGGCSDTISKTITVAPFDFVRVPNAFTPNNDGKDDTFGALYAGEIDFIEMRIYNEYGNLVYKASDINERWDGTRNGKPQNSGTYVYIIEYMLNEEVEVLKGNLTLLK